MPGEVNKRTQQKEMILEEAGKLFWDRGYDKTSIRDIARVCGFEPSNIYYYFTNKEHILFGVVWQEIHRLIEKIKHLENDESISPVERLKSLIKIHVDVTLQNKRASYRMVPDVEVRNLSPRHRKKFIAARDDYDRIVRKIIKAGIDSGDFAPMDEKLAGFMIASIIIRSRIWFSPKGKYSTEELADFIFDFVSKGLMAGKAKRR